MADDEQGTLRLPLQQLITQSHHQTDNIAQQQEEVVALQSIFPEQFKYDQSTKVCTVLLPDATTPSVEITLCLPPRYPSHDPPSATITGLADAPRAALLQSLHAAFTPGEVVLFTWVDHLLTTPESWQPPAAAPAEPPPAAKPPGPRPPITHGEPVTERKSTFQAHVAPVKRVEEVQSVMASLLAVNKIRSATHNIMAYRIQDPLTGTLMQVR